MVRKSKRVGLWLVAGYWFARSATVVVLSLSVYRHPDLLSRTVPYLNFFGPFMWMVRLKGNACLAAAPFSALVCVSAGVGILLCRKWALSIAVSERIIPLVRMLILFPLVSVLDHGMAAGFASSISPLDRVDILLNVLMTVYLIQPEVRGLFGIS